MKLPKRIATPHRRSLHQPLCFVLLTMSLLGGLTALAQQSPPAPVPSETIVLSPFEVRTDRDTGFAAASSLAGGRLAIDLRDTPVAYSVITRDFIDALNLPDLQSAAEWTTSSASVTSQGLANAYNTPVNYSTRGLSTFPDTRPQRNFFPQWNNGDSYNLERYDFGRGPNSVLFGNSLLGGASSSTTKRARTDRAFQTVQASVGSWRNYRTTFDVNRPLNDKIALRAAAVWGDSDGWRRGDFDKRKAAFLTATFKPFKNTEIRLEGEYGTNSRQSGFTDIDERFTGWDGRTTYNAPRALSTLPADANALGVGRRPANYFVYLPGKTMIMNYADDPMTLAGGSTATTPIAGYTYGSNVSFVGSNNSLILHALDVPSNRFDTAIANSFFRVPSEEFTMSPNGPVLTQRFKDLQLTVSHRIGDLFLEIAGDVNRQISYIPGGEQYRGDSATFIDINRVLPNGDPNPNYLQPYGDGSMAVSWRTCDYNNLRAAAAHVKDTRFGKFAFNVMGGINLNTTTRNDRYASIAQGADRRVWGSGLNGAQQIRIRRYWNATSRPAVDSLRPLTLVDPVAGTTQTIQPVWVIDANSQGGQLLNTYDYKYLLASLNAKFFKDRLVFLGAVRSDNYYNLSEQQISRGDYPANWDGQTRTLRPNAPADWATLTYFPRDPVTGAINGPAKEASIRPRNSTTRARDPLYANDRFKDDYNAPAVEGRKITKSVGSVLHLASWFNPSINYAETFNPPGNIVRIDGRQLEPTVASGTDYGLRMELFQNRLNLNFTYYESEEVNGMAAELPNAGAFNTLYNANAVGDQSPGGRNIRGQGDLPATYRDMMTRSNRGFEIEVVYNPTKAIRLLGNIAFPKVFQSALNPEVKAYVAANGALFQQIARDAGVIIDSNNVASVDASVPINNRSPDVNAAVTAYNGIYSDQRSIMDGQRCMQDNPIINVFGDYTFQTGPLKRLRLGGGVRYRGKQIAGWRGDDTIVDPANPTRAIDDPTVSAYTPVYTPSSWYTVTGNASYTWKLKNQRDLVATLTIDNLLNARGPIYVSSYTGGGVAVRPKGGNYASPARETVSRLYALKQPISFNFSLTLKL